MRKRKLKGSNRHDSPGPSRSSKVWKQDMSCGSSAVRKSEEPDSEGEKHLISSQVPKKKTKSRKNFKGKEKKQKTSMSNNAQVTGLKLGQKGKIPSLMDLEFPPSISARNLEKGPADVQPNYSSTSHGDKHGRFTDAEFDDRSRSEYRSQSESGAEVQAGFRVHDRDTRHLESHTRKSGGDRRLLPSEYDIEHRCPDYVDYDGHRDNIRCGNYEADYRHYEQDDSVSSRRNKHSYIDQDAPRGNTGRLVDSRSPDFHRHSDSDQDSDRDGTRRSWREEKRSRHSKRKNEKSVDDEAKVKATKNVLKKDKRHSDRMSSLKKSEKSQSGKPSADRVEDADSNSDNKKGEVEAAVRHLILPMLDSLVVLLAHPHEICLRGRARLCVVTGSISIMGYQMTANRTRHYDVYSPASSSFLTVRTQSMEKDKKVLRKSLKALGIEEKQVHDFMEGAVILVARRLNAPVVDFISSLPTFSQLFKFNLDRSAGNMPPPPPHHQQMVRTGVAILPVDQVPGTTLRLTNDFDMALQKWLTMIRENAVAPVAVMCGGQNCGKSTLARHMVNAALAIVPRVCFLECDVGQTEFSPPGCVALTFVDKPVLGPPFCHQTTAESMCFVGLTSPGESPTRYIHCLQHVFRTYRKQEPALPLVVNTMGWNEGLGLKLFMDTLNLTAPDLIVQMDSSNQALNFPVMTPELVALEPGWLYNTDPVGDSCYYLPFPFPMLQSVFARDLPVSVSHHQSQTPDPTNKLTKSQCQPQIPGG
ncbi:uncharacterized protein LOC112571683 isoform X2 [Pomacea canaliculata]|uniref:uncharacterized protein LOC112571683 isoform X2 n=1 Tax=Pomacea canaliculata TaxID=400727 RepID=UPI000D730742|nr:uncharacterized protein LOC112571683 isoform X2 [Pomacea canaliculata]XP_025106668.1 uncharacterized protein LOC112571683 isoform X2 [Pomacea canaliculata]